jgi:plastocyanin
MGSAIAAGAAIALAILALAPAAQGGEPHVYVIEVDKLAFGPSPAGIHVNDIVEWRNMDIFRHSATASDGSFDVDLPPGSKGQVIIQHAGAIAYVCRFHPGMKGRLEVEP